MGYLFGISKDTEWYPDAAGVSILGYTDDGVLYEVVRPTDVSCDVENEDTLNEYQGMMQQSDTVVQNAVIDTQNLHKDADQYIIPVSMTQTISADSLINMSDNDLWLARNEIYARHGRVLPMNICRVILMHVPGMKKRRRQMHLTSLC